MTPDISVIMPAYNRAQYIGAAIKSIQNQTHKNWELIIINDGSSDDTQKRIERLAKQDTRIQVQHQKNKGVARTRNRAIKLARADWVLGHDDDDLCHPQLLEKYLQTAKSNPALNFVSSHINYMSATGYVYYNQALPTFMVGSLLSRAKLQQIGAFRPLFPVAEDLDYFLRWQEAGMERQVLPEKMYFYRRHPKSRPSLSNLRERFLYHFSAYYAQWHRQQNGTDPITDASTLDSICAQVQKLPQEARAALVQKFMLHDYLLGYFAIGEHLPLSQIKQHLQHLGYAKKDAQEEIALLRKRIFKKYLQTKFNHFIRWSNRRDPLARQNITHILQEAL